MNYSEAMKYLNGIAAKGSIYGLETMREFLEEFGNPQENLKCIHVAGTNGKGSVIAFLDSVLRRAGYKVGRYVSPAVLEYREKIQINGEYISEADVAGLVTEIKEVANRGRKATVFETETIMAFLYFSRQKCDYVIVETGLGGAEDATNVIKSPFVSVITSISKDHMNILGDTLEEIASCKAGIIKANRPAVVMKQPASVLKVFEEKCNKSDSELIVSDYEQVELLDNSISYRRFDYKDYKDMVISLVGKYQINNAALALDVISELRRQGIAISNEAIYDGMATAEWPARFSCLDDGKVMFFADGAHNADAARTLKETIEEYFFDKKLIFIMGVLADKEYESIIKITASLAEYIYTITPDSPRALSAEDLKTAVSRVNKRVEKALTLREAVDKAYKYAKSGDAANEYVIIAFGSLSYMGELYRVFGERQKGGKTMIDQAKVREAITLLLEAIGENPDREGLKDTPDRVARMYEELCGGMEQDAAVPLSRTFSSPSSEMVMQKDITFYSMCEHHMLPFFGKVHIAYIPNGKVVGLSKLARTVEVFARRLQIQEQMTAQIADAIMDNLNAKGAMVVVEAEHMCMTMRGVKKPGSKTLTYVTRGEFADSKELRDRVFFLVTNQLNSPESMNIWDDTEEY